MSIYRIFAALTYYEKYDPWPSTLKLAVLAVLIHSHCRCNFVISTHDTVYGGLPTFLIQTHRLQNDLKILTKIKKRVLQDSRRLLSAAKGLYGLLLYRVVDIEFEHSRID